MRTTFTCGVLLVAMTAPTPGVAGTLLFDSAEGAVGTQGTLFGVDSYLMHRFEIDSAAIVEEVGGVFNNFDDAPATFFGAVVSLSGPNDLPDANDLSGGDLLGTTLLEIGGSEFFGVELSAPISLELAPGWYGLVFGAGDFGASSGSDVDLGMPALATDLAPLQVPVSLFQPDHPTNPNLIVNQNSAPRFFVIGVPEPGAGALLMAALLVRGLSRGVASRAPSDRATTFFAGGGPAI